MNASEKFKTNGYCLIKSAITCELRDVITQYALFDEMQNFKSESSQGRNQVPNAHSVYADPAMESLLLHLQPVIEQTTGLNLFPTYSYYRIYRDGDELVPHTDRPSCEISASLCLNYDYNNKDFTWPIFMKNEKMHQVAGDMVIYRGCDLQHHREKMCINDPEAWHLQAFFHYVDANGPCKEWKFDKRSSIGYLENSNVESGVQKNYIRYTK